MSEIYRGDGSEQTEIGHLKDNLLISEYRHKRRVQFYETDAAGIVHFSCFFRYMEEAEHAMWREAGLQIAPPGFQTGWPRIATSFEFHEPLRFEDEFEVWIRITAITEKTIRYGCLLTKDGVKIATGTMTIVYVKRGTNDTAQSIPIPPTIRAHFAVASDL